MACSSTTTLTYGDRSFRLNFFAQYLITLQEMGNKTMFISVGPVQNVIEYTSVGQFIGYFFHKQAWAENKHTPHNNDFGKRLNTFKDLSFHIKNIKAKKIDQDTDLPMGPPPVGLAEITFGFEWMDGEQKRTASQSISFQTITAEQFAAEF